MRLAEAKELEDWQELCYVEILKYETPWRTRAKVAGLQQAGSQSVTWIPPAGALDNASKLLLSRMPSTLRFLHRCSWKNQGTHYVLVRHTVTLLRTLWHGLPS